jgi:hypothetical protein
MLLLLERQGKKKECFQEGVLFPKNRENSIVIARNTQIGDLASWQNREAT